LQVAGRGTEFDTCGDESDESVGESLSPHPEIGTNDRGFSGEQRDPIRAFGGGIAIQTEVDDGMN